MEADGGRIGAGGGGGTVWGDIIGGGGGGIDCDIAAEGIEDQPEHLTFSRLCVKTCGCAADGVYAKHKFAFGETRWDAEQNTKVKSL